jgi:uncharacterized LabA/DUF88 family protein
MTQNRTSFLIDGFNVYHSVQQASHDLGGVSTKWLNVHALCGSYLHMIGNNAQIQDIHYFSALAHHLVPVKPDVVKRHMALLDCLRDTGVNVELARFKDKEVWCDNCHNTLLRHEEKETDVAIAVKLLELFHTNSCDTVVLVTGDTDLAPAVKTAKRLFPQKTICFAFPYKRKNRELSGLVSRSFRIRKEHYQKHQFPDPYVMQDGRKVNKPPSW